MKPTLEFAAKSMRVACKGQECCVPDLLGESILQNQLKFNLEEEDEIYQGYGRKSTAYPYRQYNAYTRELTEQAVKTAVLENDYLKAVFLPEYGGRLWELWDKETGKNLLYTNDVIRFSNLAVRNAWFSGGVEWNIGVIGHNPFTIDALYTAKLEKEDGTPVLRMYEYERIRKVAYQMDFWLDQESRSLNCRMRIANESEEVIPMYWWSNMAVPEYVGGRVVVPAKTAFTNAEGVVYKVNTPVVEGVDVTDYRTIPTSVDYFFDIPEEEPKYIANLDETGYGMLHISTKRLRSRKLFTWGNREGSDHWQEFLTDQAGRYIEIQAGLGKTQYGCIPMAPNTAWEWMEQYSAVSVPAQDMMGLPDERESHLTKRIKESQLWEKQEELLKQTKNMAKKSGELVYAGSGYGALAERGPLSSHLEFCGTQDSLKEWKEFFTTGILHCPNPIVAPDEFLIEESNLHFLKENMEEKNKGNWYAHFHLGVGYYISGHLKKAKKELLTSNELVENAWAHYALSCTFILLNRKKKAVEHILKGIRMIPEEITYLKEGFKILTICESYKRLCTCYEQLGKEQQSVGKLRYYYIHALHKLENDKKAYKLLEEGLEIDDIREGEDSVAQLWSELYESLHGEKKPIPHKYNFRTS